MGSQTEERSSQFVRKYYRIGKLDNNFSLNTIFSYHNDLHHSISSLPIFTPGILLPWFVPSNVRSNGHGTLVP